MKTFYIMQEVSLVYHAFLYAYFEIELYKPAIKGSLSGQRINHLIHVIFLNKMFSSKL